MLKDETLPRGRVVCSSQNCDEEAEERLDQAMRTEGGKILCLSSSYLKCVGLA